MGSTLSTRTSRAGYRSVDGNLLRTNVSGKRDSCQINSPRILAEGRNKIAKGAG